MDKQPVIFLDLGKMDYQPAWEYQENLLQQNVKIKSVGSHQSATCHYLLFVEHPPVYTLGKSGKKENVLLDEVELKEKNIQFFHTIEEEISLFTVMAR